MKKRKAKLSLAVALCAVVAAAGTLAWAGASTAGISIPDIAGVAFKDVTKTKPAIASFTTSPASVTSGKQMTLSWSVTGATSLSIDQGVGAVTGTSKVITPPKTAVYTLSAVNAAGTTTASVTVLVTAGPDPIPPFSDDFSGYKAGSCLTDGATLSSWTVVFAGYGCVSIEGTGAALQQLGLSPKASSAASETHAALVVGPSRTAPFTYSVQLTTAKQLRTKTPPNAWEVGWVVWDYTDGSHFYYFIPKPNGWELGKLDPAYPGGQRFLATGSSPQFPVGKPYTVKVVTTAAGAMTVSVNGAVITSFTDTQTPYKSGKIGFYTEDAHVLFDNASVQ